MLRDIFFEGLSKPVLALGRRHWASVGNGVSVQAKTLARLTTRYAQTDQGKIDGICPGMVYRDFRAQVPCRAYEDFTSQIERCLRGEVDVLWPGRCAHFAVSSGTTAGKTKYLPVTDAMLRHFRRTGLESLLLFAERTGKHRIFGGKHLFLGGSTALEPVTRPAGVPAAWSGDLSGITALKMPAWAERFLYEPGKEIAQVPDWPTKIDLIAERTLGRDIRVIAGIPSWLLVFAEALLKRNRAAGRSAASVKAVWPNLDCIIHGGVPLGPFERELNESFGDDLDFHEVFPASEGFIAAQDAEKGAGLRLFTDAGIFYEFIPIDDYTPDNVGSCSHKAISLEEVRTGVDYVLVMSTPAGLVRYVIGDLVRFLDTQTPRLVYAGRTRLQLSAFGEHVIERELTEALVRVCNRYNVSISTFHVAPVFPNESSGLSRGCHEWWLASASKPETHHVAFGESLDAELRALNDDYDAKRKGGGLTAPQIRFVHPSLFESWMKGLGKWGGQHKMPRCRSDRQIADQLLALLH